VSERPIEYGADECEYCKMMIMDQRYGSELVTEKGKVYTFDAAECLIEYLQYNEEMAEAARYLLVTPYTDPNHLIDARGATYLVSEQMPSPMGAYLTAFSDRQEATAFQSTKGGVLYTWEEIYKDFKSIRLKAIEEFE
jgi:copper chaperone NosL